MVQQRNNSESYLKKVVSMRKIGPGGHSFTSGVSPKNNNMLGEQIIARKLTNHDRITILL